MRIEKYVESKVWTAIVDDADQGYLYIKRCTLDDRNSKQSMIGGNPASKLLALSDAKFPRFEVKFGGGDAFRENLVIDADEFIGVKSFKAKGKRVSNFAIDAITEIEPREVPEEETVAETAIAEMEDADTTVVSNSKEINQQEVRDQLTGQTRLFDDDDE